MAPDVAAMLERLLGDEPPRSAREQRPPAAPATVRRKPEPPGAKLEIRYVLDLSRESKVIVEAHRRRVPPNGAAEPWEAAPVTVRIVERLDDRADREVLRALLDLEASLTARGASLSGARADDEPEPQHRFVIPPAASASMLPKVARTGRLRVRRPGHGLSPALAWRDTPWSFRLRATIVADPVGGAAVEDAPWDVCGILRSGPLEVPLAEAEGVLEAGFAVARGLLARLDDGGASSWLGMLRTHASTRITASRRAAFLEELFTLPDPPLDLPPGVALAVVDAPMTPRLFVHPPESASPSAALRAQLSFAYDTVVVSSRRAGRVVFDAARACLVRRDADAEAKAAARVAALGVEPLARADVSESAHLAIAASRLQAVIAELLAEGWQVEAAGRKVRRASAWSTSVRSGVDWLEVHGEVRFGGVAAALPRVLEALRKGETSVVLDDGSLGVLPERWLAMHGVVLRLGVGHEDAVRFAATQLPLLDALAAADPDLVADEAFAKKRAEVAPVEALAPADPPATFLGDLRGYQRAGLAWIRSVERAGLGGLLADEMGLGKTIQVLSHLAGRGGDLGPSLVVAPRSLVFNWKREAQRFAPSLRVLDHTGVDRLPPGAHFADHDLVLTTYGTLRRDADALAAIPFDYVVLDEAQAIKNDGSDTARAARRLKARHKLALSGTPVENHLGELWSLVEFLNPGMLGRSSAWKATTDAGKSADGAALLGRALRPFLLRRTKREVAPDLPSRMEETRTLELGEQERELYESLRARLRSELLGHAKAQGVGASSARVLEALLRLRQAACHPGLVDPARKGDRSAKLAALLPEIASLRANGQKALVFSQFRSLLDLVRPALEADGVLCDQLDGTTRDREAVVERFQKEPDLGVLLVSLKAGGVGINLTAAEYVFLLDPWWNPAAEAQAIDRAHRIGQTRAVFAYRLIAKDTVEERIAELQASKRALADSVIAGDGAPLRDLSIDDLDRLLS